MAKSKTVTVNKNVVVSDYALKVVDLLTRCKNVNEIAVKLNVNENTLKQQIASYKKQFGVETATGLVAYFFRNNLIK